jgi:hypothetical protein
MPVVAEFETISIAYEVALSNFTIPATPSSSVILSQCDDCERIAIRVTPETVYTVNEAAVTLNQFRKIVFEIRDRERETMVVLHHLESDTVRSVSVTL